MKGLLDDKQTGAFDIAKTGTWDKQSDRRAKSAKIGVTTSGDKHHVIFGDLNQQGAINPPHCEQREQ